MPRQRTNYSRRTYAFPEDFPQRLKRFKEESGLSWSECSLMLLVFRYWSRWILAVTWALLVSTMELQARKWFCLPSKYAHQAKI